jgi:hypothetical protein
MDALSLSLGRVTLMIFQLLLLLHFIVLLGATQAIRLCSSFQ